MLAATVDVVATIEAEDLPSDVARAAGGDRQAFERVYRTHVNRVFSICVRMCGRRDRAEDLTQDVFVRVWEKLPTFRGESAFTTWLHRLAVNVVLNDRKVATRERARAAPTNDEDDDAEETYGATAPPSHADRLDLDAAIARLPRGARRVFVLHDVEGFRHEEIADLLGITSGGSKAQLHRARLLLREALNR